MMLIKQLMVLVLLEQATTDNGINNTSDVLEKVTVSKARVAVSKEINSTSEVLERVAVSKAITNTSDVFQQAIVGKGINIKTDFLEQTTVRAINNTTNALEQVPVGKEINNTNYVCGLFNIKQFRDKTCANLVNSTYIVNIKNLHTVTEICEKVIENYVVNIENNTIALCEEVHDCVVIISSSVNACIDIVRRILPEELDLNKIENEIRDIHNTLLPIQYTFFGIFMLAGIAMNGLLIVIFIRHKNARTDPILINLAVVDIFNLVIIIPVKI
jgi:hypothetical protein